MSEDGFLSRWARRKAEVKRGAEVEAQAAAPHPGPLPASGAREQDAASPTVEPEGPPQEPPPPTMEDVAALTKESDYARFLAPKVDESVKRAALKKLFTDPHFNVMDGLDTYIDDYGRPDPIPESMLRRMAQAKFLGLFDDEKEEPKASPDGAAPAPVPQSTSEPPAVPPDEDPDLRLQQDDAAGPGGTGEGPPA